MNYVLLDSIYYFPVQLLCVVMVMCFQMAYAIPFPMIVFLGVKVVLPVFKAAETIPVCSGKILTLFFATIGMEICCM